MKMRFQISKIVLAGILLLAGSTCFAQQPTNTPPLSEQTQFPKADEYANTKLTYTIIPAENNTWGYEICEGYIFLLMKAKHRRGYCGRPDDKE